MIAAGASKAMVANQRALPGEAHPDGRLWPTGPGLFGTINPEAQIEGMPPQARDIRMFV
jgi:hypothetical protein